MTLIRLDDRRPSSRPSTSVAAARRGDVVPFGETDLEVVRNMIDAFHAIGEARLLDPFNGREDRSGGRRQRREGL